MKRGLKVTIKVLAIFLLLAGAAYLLLSRLAAHQLAAITYEQVDLAQVADGVYVGETNTGLVAVKVQVTVAGGKITSVEILEHKNGLGKKAESITAAIVTANDYAVDAVSGATLSSAAIKSAVSKALKAGAR